MPLCWLKKKKKGVPHSSREDCLVAADEDSGPWLFCPGPATTRKCAHNEVEPEVSNRMSHCLDRIKQPLRSSGKRLE